MKRILDYFFTTCRELLCRGIVWCPSMVSFFCFKFELFCKSSKAKYLKCESNYFHFYHVIMIFKMHYLSIRRFVVLGKLNHISLQTNGAKHRNVCSQKRFMCDCVKSWIFNKLTKERESVCIIAPTSNVLCVLCSHARWSTHLSGVCFCLFWIFFYEKWETRDWSFIL